MSATPYDLLGVPPSATSREVRLAYANLLKSCDQEKELERFQAIRQAYELAIRVARDNEQSRHRTEETTSQFLSPLNGTSIEQATPTCHSEKPAPPPLCVTVSDAAQTALEAIADAYIANPDARPMDLLSASLSDEKFLAIDERERFEQLLLAWIFEPKLKIAFLDAAATRLGWETVNRHLHDYRPDLAWRMSRHLALSHMINALPDAKRILADAQYYFDYIKEFDQIENGRYQIPCTLIQELSTILSPLMEAYPVEMNERFSKHISEWQENTINQPTLPSTETSNSFFSQNASIWPIYSPILSIFLILVLLLVFGAPSSRNPAPLPYAHEKTQQADACPISDKDLRLIFPAGQNQLQPLFKLCLHRLRHLGIAPEQTHTQLTPPVPASLELLRQDTYARPDKP